MSSNLIGAIINGTVGALIGGVVSLGIWLTRGYIKKNIGIDHIFYFIAWIPISIIIGAIIGIKYKVITTNAI